MPKKNINSENIDWTEMTDDKSKHTAAKQKNFNGDKQSPKKRKDSEISEVEELNDIVKVKSKEKSTRKKQLPEILSSATNVSDNESYYVTINGDSNVKKKHKKRHYDESCKVKESPKKTLNSTFQDVFEFVDEGGEMNGLNETSLNYVPCSSRKSRKKLAIFEDVITSCSKQGKQSSKENSIEVTPSKTFQNVFESSFSSNKLVMAESGTETIQKEKKKRKRRKEDDDSLTRQENLEDNSAAKQVKEPSKENSIEVTPSKTFQNVFELSSSSNILEMTESGTEITHKEKRKKKRRRGNDDSLKEQENLEDNSSVKQVKEPSKENSIVVTPSKSFQNVFESPVCNNRAEVIENSIETTRKKKKKNRKKDDENLNDQEIELSLPSDSQNDSETTHKKKKKNRKKDDENSNYQETELSLPSDSQNDSETTRKKKKKNRKKDDENSNYQETELSLPSDSQNDSETTRKKKMKNRKKDDENSHDQEIELLLLSDSQNGYEETPKKKKRKKDDENSHDQEIGLLLLSDSENDSDTISKEKTKKKHRKKDDDNLEDQENELPQSKLQSKSPTKVLSKNCRILSKDTESPQKSSETKSSESFMQAEGDDLETGLVDSEENVRKGPRTKTTRRSLKPTPSPGGRKMIDLADGDEGILDDNWDTIFNVSDNTKSQSEGRTMIDIDRCQSMRFRNRKDVNVEITWRLCPLHRLNAGHLTKTQLAALDARGVKVKMGRFTREELEILKRNWDEFRKEHDVEDFNELLSLPRKTRRNIIRFLGQGLEDRQLDCIAKKVRVCFARNSDEKLTDEEIRHLKSLIDVHGPNWTIIGQHLDRPSDMVRVAARRLETYNNDEWTEEDDEKLKSVVMKTIGQENSVAGTVDSQWYIPWTAIAKQFGRKGGFCRQRWLGKLYKELPESTVEDGLYMSNEDKLRLVRRLRDLDVSNLVMPHFIQLSSEFPDCIRSGYELQRNWYNMIRIIPDRRKKTLKELLELMEVYLLGRIGKTP